MKTPEQIFIENAKVFENDEVGHTELCTKKEAIKMMLEYGTEKHFNQLTCHLKERIEKIRPLEGRKRIYIGSFLIGLILGIIIGKFIF